MKARLWEPFWERARVGLPLAAVLLLSIRLSAQACTTQARMAPEVRNALGTAALTLAQAVLANNAAAVRTDTLPEFATNFDATAGLIRATSERMGGGSVRVSQVYLLDATNRKAGDGSDAEFSCPLAGTTAETDFSINALPPGRYGFALAESSGAHPYALAFLLKETGEGAGAAWKMAGFYSHPRAVAGHDGLWFWTAAREDLKAGRPWLAWVRYGEAGALLRPAPMVSSTHLDRLLAEQHTATPPELADGISAQVPLVLKAADGTEFRFTSIAAEPSDDNARLNLTLHLRVDGQPDATSATARNLLAARTLLGAHADLRDGFDGVFVIADAPGNNPFTTLRPMAEVAAGR